MDRTPGETGPWQRRRISCFLNLGWDKRWGTEAYFGNYPCVDDEVLDHVAIKGHYKGIGFDVIGLDPMDDATSLPRHKNLFEGL